MIARKNKTRTKKRIKKTAPQRSDPWNPYSHVPPLRFSPTAWAKLHYLRDLGPTEIGGFGITLRDDSCYVQDIRLVRQECTSVTVALDDTAVADFFDEQVDLGRLPEEFSRIWIHTHPGRSARPSSTDESTFRRVFGCMDWAVMFILARGGETYARLQFNVGPKAQLETRVTVDFGQPFEKTDAEAWQTEYGSAVQPQLDHDAWWEQDASQPQSSQAQPKEQA